MSRPLHRRRLRHRAPPGPHHGPGRKGHGAVRLRRLCHPVRGDDAQPGARVEEEPEVNHLWRHREVEQDEVECAVRGSVESLAGIEGVDVVGPSLLELSLRHEQGVGVLEPGRAPCCSSLTRPCRVSTSVMRW